MKRAPAPARLVLRLVLIYAALLAALVDCRAMWRGSDANVGSYAPYPASRYPAVERYIKEMQKW